MSFEIGRAHVSVTVNRTQAIAGLGAITAAAGVAGAALAALPALGASVAGIGGVLVGSFSGVGEALKGYQADQKAATKVGGQSAAAAGAQARQIRDAQQSIDEARRNAVKVARDSTEKINEARKDERRVAEQVRDQINDAREDERRVAEDAAEAIADARDRQADVAESGAEKIADASRKVADALDDERDAHDDLADAIADHGVAMDELREKVSDYALTEEDAAIRVERSKEKLAEVMADEESSALDLREARNDLAQAEERLLDLQRERAKSTAELAEAERLGVNGAEKVITAQEKLEDAQRKVAEAQADATKTARDVAEANVEAAEKVSEAVSDGARKQADAAEKVADAVSAGAEKQADAAAATAKAQRDGAEAQQEAARAVGEALEGLADAQAAQGEAMAAAAPQVSAYADAMAKLLPTQRELVLQLIAMGPLVDGLKRASSETFLPGLTQMLKDSEGLFPIFEGHLRRTGTIMGDTAREFGEMFKTPEFKANLDALFKSSDPITRAIGNGLVSMTGKLVEFGAKMTPASQGFATFLDDLFIGFNDMLTELEPYADDFKVIWESLGRIAKEVLPGAGRAIGRIAEALAPVLDSIADFLEKHSDKIDDIIIALGAMFLAMKAAGLVKTVAGWSSQVIGMFDDVWNSADGNGKGRKGKGGLPVPGVPLPGVGAPGGGIGGALKAAPLAGLGAAGAVLGSFYAIGSTESADAQRFGGGIGGEILAGISNAFRKPGGLFAGLVDGIISGGDFTKLKTEWGGVTGFISEKWDGLLGVLPPQAREISDGVTASFTAMPGAITGFFATSSTGSLVKLDEFNAWAGTKSQEIRDNVSRFLSELPGRVTGWFTGMKDSGLLKLTEFRDWAGTKAMELRDRVSSFISELPGRVAGFFTGMKDGALLRLDDFRNWAGTKAGELRDRVSNFIGELPGRITGFFSDMRNRALGSLDDFRNWAGTKAQELKDRIMGGISSLPDQVRDVFTRVKDWAIGRLNELRDAARAPIDFVVNTVYHNGIKPVWNGIADVFGMQKLATGGILPGYTPGRDVHMAALSGGEAVMRPEWTRAAGADYVNSANRSARMGGVQGAASFIQANGLPGFAEGGIVGDIWSKASGFISGLFSGGASGAVRGLFDGVLGDSGRTPGRASSWRDASMKVAPRTVDAVIAAAKKWMESAGGGAGGVGGALAFARAQVGKPYLWAGVGPNGYDCSGFMSAIANVIQGKNPFSRRGATGNFPWPGFVPGMASPFTIGSVTGDPGHMAGTLAGVNVESSGGKGVRVGAGARGTGNAMFRTRAGMVMDTGGRLPSGMAGVNLSGRPERVLTDSQNRAFERLVEHLDAQQRTTQGRRDGDVHVHLEQASGSPAETGRFVALAMRTVG